MTRDASTSPSKPATMQMSLPKPLLLPKCNNNKLELLQQQQLELALLEFDLGLEVWVAFLLALFLFQELEEYSQGTEFIQIGT